MTEQINSSLIRKYVDGELSPEEAGAFEARLADNPQAVVQVEFERQLRDRVSIVMSNAVQAAPEGLADRIRTALAEGDAEHAEPPLPIVMAKGGDEPPVEPSAEERRRRWMFPQRANTLAIAATLLIVAGVIIVSNIAPPIGHWGQRAEGSLIAQAVDFVAEHHGKCAFDSEYLLREGPYHSPAEAREHLSRYLDQEMVLFDFSGLADAYRFIGAGECSLPGAEPSCHLIYRRDLSERDDPERAAPYIASVFIERDRGQFELTQEIFEHGRKACGPDGKHEVRYFSDGNLVYFVMTCDVDDMLAITESVKQQLRAAESAR